MSHKQTLQLAYRLKDEINQTAVDITFEGDDIIGFFLAVAKNKSLALGLRMDAARAAAPYVRARKTSVELTGKDGGPLLIEQIATAALAAVAAEREEEKRKRALH